MTSCSSKHNFQIWLPYHIFMNTPIISNSVRLIRMTRPSVSTSWYPTGASSNNRRSFSSLSRNASSTRLRSVMLVRKTRVAGLSLPIEECGVTFNPEYLVLSVDKAIGGIFTHRLAGCPAFVTIKDEATVIGVGEIKVTHDGNVFHRGAEKPQRIGIGKNNPFPLNDNNPFFSGLHHTTEFRAPLSNNILRPFSLADVHMRHPASESGDRSSS